MRSKAQPNATTRDPTELLGSVSSHSAGTTSMVRATVLDDSDELSRQLSLGDSEPLRFTWLSRCADVVLLGFLGEVGFEHYALTDFFQEDGEGLNQGIFLFLLIFIIIILRIVPLFLSRTTGKEQLFTCFGGANAGDAAAFVSSGVLCLRRRVEGCNQAGTEIQVESHLPALPTQFHPRSRATFEDCFRPQSTSADFYGYFRRLCRSVV